MKFLHIIYDEAEFEKILKLKAKLEITWKAVISRGLKGGKNGKNKD